MFIVFMAGKLFKFIDGKFLILIELSNKAGGITINAIVYPYYPLNAELFKRVFLRAFFGLFITEKDDLNGRDNCPYALQRETSFDDDYCTNCS